MSEKMDDKKCQCQIEAEMKDLEAYRRAIANLARKGTDHIFFNSGDDHARIVFENIFLNANDEIYIVANELLNEEVSNSPSYLDALGVFLNKKKSKLHVMVSNYDPEKAGQSKFFDLIRKHKDKVELYQMGGKSLYCKETVDGVEKKEKVHFCVADGRMVRYEYDVEHRRAQCNFKAIDTAKVLVKVFNSFTGSDKVTAIAM